jgi:hypothetical protein
MIQTVAIPGCLCVDQNARLDQERQFASIKESRSPTIKKNKEKEELFTAGRGGTRWRPRYLHFTLIVPNFILQKAV